MQIFNFSSTKCYFFKRLKIIEIINRLYTFLRIHLYFLYYKFLTPLELLELILILIFEKDFC